jgi:hypothetical protein
MNKGPVLEFPCQECEATVRFGVSQTDGEPTSATCSHCHKQYVFSDEGLQRQMKMFVDLCWQIRESEEILSDASVGINVSSHHVEIPFKLLLTRLNSHFNLEIGNKKVALTFRVAPLDDSFSGESNNCAR